MSDEKPTVNLAHDREVRALALGHAIDLARSAVGLGSGYGANAQAVGTEVLDMAEKFRAFLTVAGGPSYSAVQSDDAMRAILPPNGSVALPAQVNVVSAPTVSSPATEAFATEFRAFRQFIERVIAEERAGSGDKAP